MTTNENLTAEQESMLDLALNGEISMSSAIAWALRTDQIEFAEYLKTF